MLLPFMMLLAILGGMFWALIPAILKIRFNTNEILVSLMLTYVASLFMDFLEFLQSYAEINFLSFKISLV